MSIHSRRAKARAHFAAIAASVRQALGRPWSRAVRRNKIPVGLAIEPCDGNGAGISGTGSARRAPRRYYPGVRLRFIFSLNWSIVYFFNDLPIIFEVGSNWGKSMETRELFRSVFSLIPIITCLLSYTCVFFQGEDRANISPTTPPSREGGRGGAGPLKKHCATGEGNCTQSGEKRADSTPGYRGGWRRGLEPVINFPAGGAGSQFFSIQGARSDEYGVSSSDE